MGFVRGYGEAMGQGGIQAYVGYVWGGGFWATPGVEGSVGQPWVSHGSGCVSPRLVLVAPRLAALGTPMGVLVAAVGPVTGTVTAWPGEGDRGAEPCAPPAPFDLKADNDFSQILSIEVWGAGGGGGECMGLGGMGMSPWGRGTPWTPMSPPMSPRAPQVTPEQAKHCGALEDTVGQTLLLEAQSPPLPPRRLRVGLGGTRGVLLLQTDKPLYAPGQTGESPAPYLQSPKSPQNHPKSGKSAPKSPQIPPKSHKFPKSPPKP